MPKTQIFKQKVWKTGYADNKFSHWIRNRDGNRCIRCHKDYDLTNSHYWMRKHAGTRFEPDNCITLCTQCHAEWEHLKNRDYKDFMLQRLGKQRYDEVEHMARGFKKMRDAVLEFMGWINSRAV